jgi:hypothetical protein
MKRTLTKYDIFAYSVIIIFAITMITILYI